MANLSPALQRGIRRAVRRLQPSCPPPNWNNADWRDELLKLAGSL